MDTSVQGLRLPLDALLEALTDWAEDPGTEKKSAVRATLEVVLERAGASGAIVELDAPPLPPLRVAAGSADDGGGSESDVPESATIHLSPDERSQVTGRLVVWGDPAGRAAAGRAIERALDLAWARSEARFGIRRLAALEDATRAIAGELGLDRVLQVIVDRVRPLVEARYAALGIVGDDGWFERFITSGVTDAERRRIGHIPRGLGLLGHVIHEGHPIRVTDIAVDPHRFGFPPNHPPMRSFLGVPVVVHAASVGNLYLTQKRGDMPFTEADERLVETFAVHAGIAIERARLHEQVRRLVVVDERDRISRDLHDGTIQSLYAIGLSLEDVPEMMGSDPVAAARHVDDAIDRLHDTIRDIRQFIVGLGPAALETEGLVPELAELAEEARHGGIADVRLDISEDVLVSPGQAVQVMHAAREAVSNAIRHAAAGRLVISLRRDDDGHVVLEVEDDGRGFDAAVDPGVGHHGLANLRARARESSGEASVESEPGRGTHVTLRITAEPP